MVMLRITITTTAIVIVGTSHTMNIPFVVKTPHIFHQQQLLNHLNQQNVSFHTDLDGFNIENLNIF